MFSDQEVASGGHRRDGAVGLVHAEAGGVAALQGVKVAVGEAVRARLEAVH